MSKTGHLPGSNFVGSESVSPFPMKFFQLTNDVLINLDHVITITKSDESRRPSNERFYRGSQGSQNAIAIQFTRSESENGQPTLQEWKWPDTESRDRVFDFLREAMGIKTHAATA